MDTKYIGLADKFAVSTSTICVVHCVAVPFLISVFPAIGASIFGAEAFHVWLLWAVIPLSVFGLTLGCRKHKNMKVMATGALGVSIIVFAALAGHDFLNDLGERVATVTGALIIAWAHIRNYRICRSTDCDHG